jgi:hypothetical protein
MMIITGYSGSSYLPVIAVLGRRNIYVITTWTLMITLPFVLIAGSGFYFWNIRTIKLRSLFTMNNMIRIMINGVLVDVIIVLLLFSVQLTLISHVILIFNMYRPITLCYKIITKQRVLNVEKKGIILTFIGWVLLICDSDLSSSDQIK